MLHSMLIAQCQILSHSVTAKDIASIIVSAGLAANFAAIRALTVEGIQRGHMVLHSKNIAVSVLPSDEHQQALVEEVALFMNNKGINNVHRAMATKYLEARDIEFGGHSAMNKERECFPSTFMVDDLLVVIDVALMLMLMTMPMINPLSSVCKM